ncbi:RHS repeat-associated core domain-containing protein [Photorhabdus australis]|uniref:RHS repeat-associated core domain-containing protein n=1 Tax=Photorhabdus australis TaxID=286156 RepID=UPI0009DE9070|nr:RHS repeat-associated core domain-containing protein [Photorhabdus australis]
MSSTDYSLFKHTPTVTVLDNRGLAVRDIAYHRHPDTPAITDERITRHQHDVRGFLTQSTDPRLYDAQQTDKHVKPNFTYLTALTGEVLQTKSADAGITVALNDIASRPFLAVTGFDDDNRGNTVIRTWQYERVPLPGRLLSVTEQTAGEQPRITERFVYAGHTQQEKDRNLAGQCVSHYDPAGLNRVDSIALNGVLLSVTRRLLKNADDAGMVADWQDEDDSARNELLDEKEYKTLTTADATGAPLTTTDAAGNIQRVAYDVAGLLTGSWLTVKGGTEQVIVKSLTYSAAGQKLREEHGNGVVTTYTYEPETQRLTGIRTERPAGHASGAKVLQDLRYAYDPVGNVLKISNDAEETRFWRNQKVVPENTYVYDSLYQLVCATGREMANIGQQGSSLPSVTVPLLTDSSAYTSYTRTYTYDAAGNLTQVRHSPATGSGYTTEITVSDRSNRAVLSTLTENAADVDALFTAGGQQKQLQPGQSLVWTPRNELLKVTPVVRYGTTDDQESYRYEGGSQRILKVSVQKTGNSTQTQRALYLSGLELRSTKSGDTETESLQVITVGEAGRAQVRFLHWESGRPDGISNDQIRYSYDNLTGSSQLELGGDGNVISMEEYYPYGGTAVWTVRSQIEANYKAVRYSGKERDATGLYYYGYRYYQPWTGRWLSADPAGTVDGLNLFRMVRNNPVTLWDNNGLIPSLSCFGPSAKKRFNTKMQEAVSSLGDINIPKKIHMIWIGTNNISDKNVGLSLETASKNPDYETSVIYDSGIKGHESARDYLKSKFVNSEVSVTDLRELPSFSSISSHPAFQYYEKVISNQKYAQASDLLRLLVLANEGGIYKDIDDTQQKSFGELSFPGGIGFKREYEPNSSKERAVPNTPIAVIKEHPVITRTLELAVENYQRGEENILKLAGPDVFTQALYEKIDLSSRNLSATWDKMKQDTFKNKKQQMTGQELLFIQGPRNKMLKLGEFVANGCDHSWANR